MVVGHTADRMVFHLRMILHAIPELLQVVVAAKNIFPPQVLVQEKPSQIFMWPDNLVPIHAPACWFHTGCVAMWTASWPLHVDMFYMTVVICWLQHMFLHRKATYVLNRISTVMCCVCTGLLRIYLSSEAIHCRVVAQWALSGTVSLVRR